MIRQLTWLARLAETPMLAIIDEKLIAVAIVGGVIALAVMIVRSWGATRLQRLRMLDDALRDDRLDTDTKRELIQKFGRQSWDGSRYVRLAFFASGWITMFAGGAVAFFAEFPTDRTDGFIAMAVGFGLLSLPIAMRELERRDQSPGAVTAARQPSTRR